MAKIKKTELPDNVAPIWTVNTTNRRHWTSIVGPVQAKMLSGDRDPYPLENLRILQVIRDRETFALRDWEWVDVDPDRLWSFADDHDLYISKEARQGVALAIKFLHDDLVIREPILALDMLELAWFHVNPANTKSGVYLGGIDHYAFNSEKAKEGGLWSAWEKIGSWELPHTKQGDAHYDPRLYWALNHINLMRNQLHKMSTPKSSSFSGTVAFVERFMPIMPETRWSEEEDADGPRDQPE